jgi:hypothetical protein
MRGTRESHIGYRISLMMTKFRNISFLFKFISIHLIMIWSGTHINSGSWLDDTKSESKLGDRVSIVVPPEVMDTVVLDQWWINHCCCFNTDLLLLTCAPFFATHHNWLPISTRSGSNHPHGWSTWHMSWLLPIRPLSFLNIIWCPSSPECSPIYLHR